MAQKLLLRPFLSFPLKQFSAPLRPQPTWLLCRPTAAPSGIVLRTPLPFTTMPATRRTFSTTRVSRHTFNIQDGDDFQDRVLKSQTPVVIDFHAHNPVRWANRLGRIFRKHLLTRISLIIQKDTPHPISLGVYRWCGPCKILGPRLEKMVAKHNGKVLMAKVDIDDHTDLALEYEVSAVPTVLAMKNGDVVDKFVGIKDEDQLEAFLKKLIGP